MKSVFSIPPSLYARARWLTVDINRYFYLVNFIAIFKASSLQKSQES